MDLLQLEHFLAVVEEGTFTRAAERVSRTQPAVSQSIKKLEEEIGASSSPATFTTCRSPKPGRRSWSTHAKWSAPATMPCATWER
jgi:hypothetical protein